MAYVGFSNYRELNRKGREKAYYKEYFSRDEKYRRYREEWSKAATADYLPDRPLNVDIELASSCNLRCTMCHQSNEEAHLKGIMSKDLAFKIIDQCKEFGVYSVKLNWRGEGTLNPHFYEIAKYAKESGIIDVQVNTNGLPYHFDQLLKAIPYLDRIIFSVDGLTKETYSKIRRGGDFDKLMGHIDTIIKARGKNERPYLRVQMVRQDVNTHEAIDFVDYWKRKVDDVRVSDAMARDLGQQFMAGNQAIIDRTRCPQPFQRLTISDKGEIFPCCSDWTESYSIGNINTMTLIEAWSSKKINHLRKCMNEKKHDQIKMCATCPVKESYVFKKDNG